VLSSSASASRRRSACGNPIASSKIFLAVDVTNQRYAVAEQLATGDENAQRRV